MNKKSIELLNKAVADKLSTIHQYLYFHFHCNIQGLTQIAGLFKKTATDEMQQVEKMAARILFLNGDVAMGPLQQVKKIKTVKEMLRFAREIEDECTKEYTVNAIKCSAGSDTISKQLFENLTDEEEIHFNRFDLQLENIGKYGDNYLALQGIGKV
jgi:bacterioferritin